MTICAFQRICPLPVLLTMTCPVSVRSTNCGWLPTTPTMRPKISVRLWARRATNQKSQTKNNPFRLALFQQNACLIWLGSLVAAFFCPSAPYFSSPAFFTSMPFFFKRSSNASSISQLLGCFFVSASSKKACRKFLSIDVVNLSLYLSLLYPTGYHLTKYSI